MKNRRTDDYRHHRERIIRKHLDFLLNVRQYDENDPRRHPWMKHPGKLAKAHRKGAYRYEKKHKIKRAPEKSRLEMMLAEMEQYEEDWC